MSEKYLLYKINPITGKEPCCNNCMYALNCTDAPCGNNWVYTDWKFCCCDRWAKLKPIEGKKFVFNGSKYGDYDFPSTDNWLEWMAEYWRLMKNLFARDDDSLAQYRYNDSWDLDILSPRHESMSDSSN